MIRYTVLFSGRVQGVGFRYTASALARDFAVTGYVRNLPDGQVEAVVEGPRDEVRRFVAAVRGEFAGNISDCKEIESPATGEFGHFGIRF